MLLSCGREKMEKVQKRNARLEEVLAAHDVPDPQVHTTPEIASVDSRFFKPRLPRTTQRRVKPSR